MLTMSTIGSSSLAELSPSPIKLTDCSIETTSNQQGGSSLLMHSSFGIHRRHSDDVADASYSTTTFRPRRSISSSASQQQTRHVVCMMNNYSHQEQQTKDMNLNLTQGQGEDSFDDDDDDDIGNELNLAVDDGNEDLHSLKGFTHEQINQENGSLDVAFIDETDLERHLNNRTTIDNEQVTSQMDIQTNESLSQTIIANCQQEQRSSIEMDDTTQSIIPILIEKSLDKENDLDEILRRNENRSVRLTDSDVS
jgi:hypothetical protein